MLGEEAGGLRNATLPVFGMKKWGKEGKGLVEALVFGLWSHMVRAWTRISDGAGFKSQHCLLLAWWPQALGLTSLSFHVLSRKVGV